MQYPRICGDTGVFTMATCSVYETEDINKDLPEDMNQSIDRNTINFNSH